MYQEKSESTKEKEKGRKGERGEEKARGKEREVVDTVQFETARNGK